ncbi:MAG: DUF692 domain-containing protein [Acidobacteria bacterium]|nr:DUF692 domain-containing protein [Acidobacteriota bacterium]
MWELTMKDRFGIGWRPELAAGILCNLQDIDVVEVIAEDYLHVSRAKIRALRTLSHQVPIILHGVSLGMASVVPVETKRLDRIARLVEALKPEAWSEHLAFVRGGGHEIGHLAAPPRTAATIEGTAKNLASARQVVGAGPAVENIATLIDPPASVYDEPTWISEILSLSGTELLLDLHNVYTNAVNFGFDPLAFLDRIPWNRVTTIHIAGGKWISSDPTPSASHRILDDHLHDVPVSVYELLRDAGAFARRPLTVILERDGLYPPIQELLAQLRMARNALAEGRAVQRRHEGVA